MPDVQENLFNQGLQAFKNQQYESACEILLKAAEEDQENHKAWNALGVALSKIDEKDQALICFENAVSLDPDNKIYLKNLQKISCTVIIQKSDTVSEKPSPMKDEINPYFFTTQYPLKKPALSRVGISEPVCPSCQGRLPAFPTRIGQCPECKANIYLKQRPFDKKKVLVNKSQLSLVESEWEEYNHYRKADNLIQTFFPKNSTPTYPEIAGEMEKKGGIQPSVFDVLWKANSKKSIAHMKDGDFGLFRDDILQFAVLATYVEKTNLALQHYLAVLFLDVNGPANNAVLKKGKWNHPPFDPSQCLIHPDIISKVCVIIENNEYTRRYVKTEFLKGTDGIFSSMNALIPVSQMAAWGIINDEIEKRVKYNGYFTNAIDDPASMIW